MMDQEKNIRKKNSVKWKKRQQESQKKQKKVEISLHMNHKDNPNRKLVNCWNMAFLMVQYKKNKKVKKFESGFF